MAKIRLDEGEHRHHDRRPGLLVEKGLRELHTGGSRSGFQGSNKTNSTEPSENKTSTTDGSCKRDEFRLAINPEGTFWSSKEGETEDEKDLKKRVGDEPPTRPAIDCSSSPFSTRIPSLYPSTSNPEMHIFVSVSSENRGTMQQTLSQGLFSYSRLYVDSRTVLWDENRNAIDGVLEKLLPGGKERLGSGYECPLNTLSRLKRNRFPCLLPYRSTDAHFLQADGNRVDKGFYKMALVYPTLLYPRKHEGV